MSFPNIPDINPCIDIKLEDAVNLLLTSIAMEEISICKLIDAETKKIHCVLDDCRQKDFRAHDVLHINKSINDTIKNLIKLQMLLQFKLENVKELLPTYPCPPCPPCPPPCPTECCCGLKGTGKGCITNRCDERYEHTAVLHACIFNQDDTNRTLRYTVKAEDSELRFYASGRNIKLTCPTNCSDKLVVHGKGHIAKHAHCNPEISDNADFILTIYEKMSGILVFRMEIEAGCHSQLNHDSGNVRVRDSCSDLRMIIVC